MKKICHVVDRLNVGGLERTLIDIVLGVEGFEHHVWCIDTKGTMADILQNMGIQVREFGFKGSLRMPSIKLLTKEMRSESFDIVHSHGIYPSVWARIAAMGAHVPIRIDHVQNIHTTVPFTAKMKLMVLARFTTKIVAVAEAVKSDLIKAIKVPASKIEVIYNSSPDMRAVAKDARQEMRRYLGLGDSFVIVAVGRLERIKGHSVLIDAVKRCVDSSINVKCIIVGSGPEEKELTDKIIRLRLQKSVSLLGTRSDIANILSCADAMIQPSTLIEGLPLVLAEGASMGLPLIATSIGGNAEIVEDGKNGYVVPPRSYSDIAEKIIFLARHGDEAKRMGENSRSIWQEKFTRDRMLQRLGELYRRCIQEWQ